MPLPVGSRKNRCSLSLVATASGPLLASAPAYQLAARDQVFGSPVGEVMCRIPTCFLNPASKSWSWSRKKTWNWSRYQATPGDTQLLVLYPVYPCEKLTPSVDLAHMMPLPPASQATR